MFQLKTRDCMQTHVIMNHASYAYKYKTLACWRVHMSPMNYFCVHMTVGQGHDVEKMDGRVFEGTKRN